jgi:hypothetical protein
MKFAVVCSGPIYVRPRHWMVDVLLEHYDPDYNKGEGHAIFTYDITKAKLFDTLEQAVAYVERPSIHWTESGMINRPIHCFQIAYRPINIDDEKRAMKNMIFTTKTSARANTPESQRLFKQDFYFNETEIRGAPKY